jgi:hypothetical protein
MDPCTRSKVKHPQNPEARGAGQPYGKPSAQRPGNEREPTAPPVDALNSVRSVRIVLRVVKEAETERKLKN